MVVRHNSIEYATIHNIQLDNTGTTQQQQAGSSVYIYIYSKERHSLVRIMIMLTRNITTCTPLLDIFGFGNLVFVGSNICSVYDVCIYMCV